MWIVPPPPRGLTFADVETATGRRIAITRRRWLRRPTTIVADAERIEARGDAIEIAEIIGFEYDPGEVLARLRGPHFARRLLLFRGRPSHAAWIAFVLDEYVRGLGAELPMPPPVVADLPTARVVT